MTTTVQRLRAAALPLALAAAFPSTQAQTALRETVVTAARSETRADELVSEVKVIDRAEIERSTARTLTELLARTAGVQMAATGGRGKTSNIFIRGAENRHTILLVDGVRLGSATAGTPSWETIPVEMIERIEILKGPGSALYGSEGVGGVVQIFTRKGYEGFHPSASLTVGSEQHVTANAGLAGGQGALTYSLGVQHQRERGINSTQPYVPFGNYNPDLDPFRQDAVTGTLRYEIGKDWSAEAGMLYSDGVSHYDDGPGIDSSTAIRAFTGHVGVKGRVRAGWQTQLVLAEGDDTANIIQASLPGAFRTRQTQWTWQNNVDTPIGVALLGVERREQKIDASTAYTVTGRSIDSAFAGINGSAGNHSWQANLRRDRNSQFGTADTWFAGYGYRISPNWRVHASQGTSFVAPSFNQLYFPGFGNAGLQPERGRNTDLGVTYTRGAHELTLVRFDNRIRGFINTTPTTVFNIPRTRIDGWTLAYEAKLGKLNLNANLEALDPRNELNGRLLPRRARQQATLAADYKLGDWTLGGSLLHVGQRFDDTANATRLAAYTTLDLSADWQFSRDWSVQGKVNNVTDRHYETSYGYNQPGRALYVTLRWQPK